MKRIFVLSAVSLFLATHAFAATAILAGGCFWCMESDFEKLPGVTDVVSGFTGGKLPNPTYNGNHEGHYESVEVTYDPQQLSYQQLLDYYWLQIDPFDDGGQFCDRGHSYLAAIFYANDEEKKIAEASKTEVQKMFPKQKVVTSILPANNFLADQRGRKLSPGFCQGNNPVRYNFYRWN